MEEKDKVQGTDEIRAGEDEKATFERESLESEMDEVLKDETLETEILEEEAVSEEDASLSPNEKKLNAELSDMKDKYTRLYAEFDNFRKRSEKEKSQMFELGAKDVIEKLLPVVDNFERALDTVEEEDLDDAFTKGVQGIYKQILKVFSDLQVEPIEALGQKFDPNLHNAVMTDEEAEAEEDTITQDLLKGYTYRGTVVRHSMVKVKK